MKKVLLRIPVLLIVFLASVFLFSSVFNRGETVSTTDFSSASLPVLYMKTADTVVNPMYGYTKRMQENTIRDGITPMDTDRKLGVVIDINKASIREIAYTVTTPDMQTTVEEQKLSLPAKMDTTAEIEFSLQEPILMNQEYLLHFTVTLNSGEKLYYYTRLLQRAGLNVTQYLNFVTDFYEKSINKETAKAITTYLESAGDTSNKDLASVDITSTFNRVTWGDLNPQIAKKAVPVIREINETTCSITMDYVISSMDDAQQTAYFYVTEFYRMRYASSRVMLLNFDRNTKQLMQMDQALVNKNGLCLGIGSDEDEVVTDANADVAAFVQAGELYTFHRTSSRLTKIFSFRTSDELDLRELNQNHYIKVIRVEESGAVDYLVYGYMNSDRYEGQNGIAVYHYDPQSNISKEQMFVPCDVSVDCLKQELEDFSYITTDNQWYVRINNTLYRINLNDGTVETMLEGIQNSCFVASSTHKTIAWADEMNPDSSRSATILDLETGNTHKVSVGEGDNLRVLGFLNEDLVYGVAHQGDIADGIFAMHTVYIESFSGDIVKKYSEEGYWVSGADVSKEYIEFSRVKKNPEGVYTPAEMDRIINNAELTSENASLVKKSDEHLGEALYLTFSQTVKGEDVVQMVSKYSSYAANQEMKVNFNGFGEGMYQVYAHGQLLASLADPKEAILLADENMGTVLNANQQYIWERGNKRETAPPSLKNLPQNILQIPSSAEECSTLLGEDYTSMDLTGCTLDEVLYFVSEGRAVSAKTKDGYVLIVGYDYYNVLLYDPEKQETYYGGMNDSTALFEASGNHFITYIENFKE